MSIMSLRVSCLGEVAAGMLIVIVAISTMSACASESAARGRYVRALDRRFEGDARGYYDELLALATDEPDTRAGRRARASLSGGGIVAPVLAVRMGTDLALPTMARMRASVYQSEAVDALGAVLRAQQEYMQRHGQYCSTFRQCELVPETGSRFVYFLAKTEHAGGDGARDQNELVVRSSALLTALGVSVGVNGNAFSAVAVGNVDADADLDVWLIDEKGNLVHVLDDAG